MTEKEDIITALKMAEASINSKREEFKKSIQPLEDEAKELRRRLGVIIAGFSPGDIIISKSGKKVRCSDVYSLYFRDYKAYGINIKKDGTEGVERELYSWDGWQKYEPNSSRDTVG